MVSLVRALVGMVGLALWLAGQAAPVAPLQLSRTQPAIDLSGAMGREAIPLAAAADPDSLWSRPERAGIQPIGPWPLAAGERTVGRLLVQGTREKDSWVLVVPNSRVDTVQVWYRLEGGDGWKGAVAGDRVPLSRWPFAAVHPAFPLRMDERPVRLVVAMANDGPLQVPLLLQPEADFREALARQAHLSGVAIGLGLMMVVVSLITALVMRRTAGWLLAAVAAWSVFTMASVNGEFAVWVTPEWTAFNDHAKHFSVAVLGGLLVSLAVRCLDPRRLTRPEARLAGAAPLLGLAYALVQVAWLPNAWRLHGAVAWSALCTLVALAMCAVSALKDGRYVAFVAAGVLLQAGAVAALSIDMEPAGVLDVRGPLGAVLLFAAVLLFRHALVLCERFGRDVLSRTALQAGRDPLTALPSYSAFQLAYEGQVLRQHAGHRSGAIVLFLLPGLERSMQDHGYVLAERALVRFSALLQALLGEGWLLARVGRDRFAAASLVPVDLEALRSLATQALAQCARMHEPLSPVGDFDVRIAAMCCPGTPVALRVLLGELDAAAGALGDGKRIAVV